MIFAIIRQIWLAALLVFIATGTIQAQETPDAESVESEQEAKKEAVEVSSDLRDAVNENLGTITKDARTADELKKTRQDQLPATEQSQDTEPVTETETETDTEPDLQAADQPQPKKSILDHFKALPGWLQSVPDKVPYIRDRGLIFFGRTEIDYAHYSSGIAKGDSGFKLRSLRFGLAKAYKYDISAKAEFDLTDGESNFADLYARYNNQRFGLFTVGNQRVAQTLVNQTSRISRTFMEEPLPAEAFGLGRRLGVGWDLHKPKGGIHVTLFGPDLNGSIGDSGYASRIYFNPTRGPFNVAHVGASYVSEDMSRKTRFYSHPESRVTDKRFVDTGIYDDITRQNIAALEIAGARDSFMFRSEFFRASWERDLVKDPVFKGFYVQASWVLTGESFNYTQGKFIRIRPENPRGAWEVAVRFSRVDLNDHDVRGGEEKNLSAALNWYAVGNQFRVMCNLIFVRADHDLGDESPTIIQLRAQFHW